MNTNAGGNEHPLTEAFVAEYSATVFPVLTIQPLIRDLGTRGTKPGQTRDRRQEFAEDAPLTFDRLAYIKRRFPSRTAQFCTEHLKLAPQKRWCREQLTVSGVGFVRYAGVRCEESAARRETPESCWDPYFQCYVYYPVRCWTKAEVFAVLRQAGEAINPLYTLGFGRVGCAPCVNSNKRDIRTWASRFPEMIEKVRAWEQSVGRTFFAPIVPGKTLNWIDDVVEWSRTSHGGRQYELPMFEQEAASGVCVSQYGLCE
jgi:hypothetical protein